MKEVIKKIEWIKPTTAIIYAIQISRFAVLNAVILGLTTKAVEEIIKFILSKF